MVGLGYEILNGSIQYQCAGFLISKNWVLSVAHCLKKGVKALRLGSVSFLITHLISINLSIFLS